MIIVMLMDLENSMMRLLLVRVSAPIQEASEVEVALEVEVE